MAKALCRLLLYVNQILVANFLNMSFNVFHENKFSQKFSNYTVPCNMWSSMPIAVAKLSIVSPHPDRCIAWLLKT